MWSHLLIRYGELFLKGKNRAVFERKLVHNIKKLTSFSSFTKIQGRLLIPYREEHLQLRKVFGLASYSPAVCVGKEVESIKKKAVELLQGRKGTFKVQSKRSDKTFPLISLELNKAVGEAVQQQTNLVFAMNPETTLCIEINQHGAFLFLETIPCAGGLPTGVEGKVVLSVEDEAGVLAGLLFMKRGCALDVLSTSHELSLLQAFSPTLLNIVETIPSYPFMVSGQQFATYQKYDTPIPVARPLIAYSPAQIRTELEYYRLIANPL